MNIIYLLFEFLDELVFGIGEAAWPLFFLFSILWLKLTLFAFVGLFVVGWYAILKANLFSAMRGQSSTVQALGSINGIIGKLIPLGIGFVAQAYSLQTAMWLLLAGPLALLVGLPRSQTQSPISNL